MWAGKCYCCTAGYQWEGEARTGQQAGTGAQGYLVKAAIKHSCVQIHTPRMIRFITSYPVTGVSQWGSGILYLWLLIPFSFLFPTVWSSLNILQRELTGPLGWFPPGNNEHIARDPLQDASLPCWRRWAFWLTGESDKIWLFATCFYTTCISGNDRATSVLIVSVSSESL